MADFEAILIKPLDGHPIGAKRTFSEADFKDLKAKDAVKLAPVPKEPDEKPEPKNKKA